MTTIPIHRRMTCSCLMDMGHLDKEVVAVHMQALAPSTHLLGLSTEDFTRLYLRATNRMYRQHIGFDTLPDKAQKKAIAEKLSRRCGLCGSYAMKAYFRDHPQPQAVQEAA